MSEIEKFDYEAIQDRQTMRQYLNALMEGIEKGKLVFSSGKEQILLAPTELIRLSVKAKRKPGKSKITMKFTWNDSPGTILREKDHGIQISA